MKVACVLLLSVTSFAQTTGADQTGGISGVVTDAATHMPIKKAIVSIVPTSNIRGGSQAPGAATTDASGAFSVSSVQAGKYRLMVQHQGYPQARFGGVAKNVEVKAGETTGPVAVELIPGAAVSGRVLDEDGDPLPNCYVQIHPAKNPEQGVSMMGNSGSNLDGEWRAFGIPAGKYILSAQCGRAAFQPRAFSSAPEPPPSKAYASQYYPLASDPKGAQVVELTAGNEKSGVDFQMTPTAVTQVHGVFSPGGADWHTGNPLMVQLTKLDHRASNNNVGAAPNLEKGTFEFRQVFPGSYMLVAFSQGGEDNRIGAAQRIDLSDKPIDVVLELKHAIDVSGKVEIENNANTTNILTPNQLNITLVPQFQVGMLASQAQVGEDGTFTVKGVLPARWRLQMGAPRGFIKSAWLGSSDVTNVAFDLSGGAAGALKIVVSTNTATIRGSAPAGFMVYAESIDDLPFHRNMATSTDQNGQYNLGGLAPGKYRLLAMESGGPMPDEGGQEVTVREGETAMADLKAPSTP